MTLFAFLDIETTGLSPDDDHILEIAWLLTDSKLEALTPLRSHISEHSQGEWQYIWSQLQSNEPVRHMHQESGLLDAIRSQAAWPLSANAFCSATTSIVRVASRGTTTAQCTSLG